AFNTNGTQNIWLMNADGSNLAPLTRLTAEFADCLSPAWSPDGSKIVYYSKRALNGGDFFSANFTNNIWVMNTDGSGTTALTNVTAFINSSRDADPSWSPDGSKIVFVWQGALNGADLPNIDSTANIWVMNADGSGATPLTKLTAKGADSEPPT